MCAVAVFAHSRRNSLLSSNQLNGSIPPELGNLGQLQELFVHSFRYHPCSQVSDLLILVGKVYVLEPAERSDPAGTREPETAAASVS